MAGSRRVSPFESVRRLGVIGDVHAQADLLRDAAAALAQSGADAIVCVGDIYTAGTDTLACCRLLSEGGILAVRGNHDRWFLEAAASDDQLEASLDPEAAAFLRALPATLTIPTATGPALVCHGLGTNDLAHLPKTFPRSFVRRMLRLGILSAQYKFVVHGHSHLHRQQSHEGIAFITVGRLDPEVRAGCIVVDTLTGMVSHVPY